MNPTLAAQIEQFPLVNMTLNPAPSGALTGALWCPPQQGWVSLCSPQDPVAEAETDATTLYTPQAKVFVLFGMGLGYLATALAQRLKPYQRLAVFEASPWCYKAAMYAVDMAPLLGQDGRRVDTSIGDNLPAAAQHFWLSLDSHEKFHLTPPIRAGYTQFCDAPLYEALAVQAFDMLRYHAVGLATWRQFGNCIGDNDLENLPEFCTTPGLNALAGAWEGQPAVCIAAGPSLVKNLPVLLDPALRAKVCVLCVGTMYATVRALGIVPDIVTTIDFQRLNWTDQFRGVPLDPRTTLVYLHSTYPQTVRRWPGPRFVGMNSSDTTAWLQRYAEPKANTSHVQTVAHLNVVTALAMGATPILLLGQDLSMPEGAHHAPGARAQDSAPADNPDAHVNADDIYGQPCWTRHSLLSMRTVFQQMFGAHPATTFLNCTEGGLHIEGAADVCLRPTLAALPVLAPGTSPLRETAAARFRAYVPQTQWTGLTQDLAGLRTRLQTLQQWAQNVCQAGARLTTDLPAAERDALRDTILVSEPVLGQLQDAFGLIAVRRFDVIELMAAIPPDVSTMTPDAVKLYNCGRLAQVAQTVVETFPVVDQLVRRCQQRLADVAPPDHPPARRDLLRMLARQSYHAVAHWLHRAPLTWPANGIPQGDYMREYARLMAALLLAQQQYTPAAVLLEAWGLARPQAQRSYAAIDTEQQTVQSALLAYLRGTEFAARPGARQGPGLTDAVVLPVGQEASVEASAADLVEVGAG